MVNFRKVIEDIIESEVFREVLYEKDMMILDEKRYVGVLDLIVTECEESYDELYNQLHYLNGDLRKDADLVVNTVIFVSMQNVKLKRHITAEFDYEMEHAAYMDSFMDTVIHMMNKVIITWTMTLQNRYEILGTGSYVPTELQVYKLNDKTLRAMKKNKGFVFLYGESKRVKLGELDKV